MKKEKEMITGYVRDVSTISHMTMHNGVPCDKYTATVKICQIGYTGAGLHSWYLVLYAKTEKSLEKKLDKYRRPELVVSVPRADLVDRGGRHGQA